MLAAREDDVEFRHQVHHEAVSVASEFDSSFIS